MEINMAITTTKRVKFHVVRIYNRTIGQYFKIDMYGAILFGYRFTSKKIADKLNELNPGSDFTQSQKNNFTIKLLFGRIYMFNKNS
jgi:hypothetical protein